MSFLMWSHLYGGIYGVLLSLMVTGEVFAASSTVYVNSTHPNALDHAPCGRGLTSPCLMVEHGLEEVQKVLASDSAPVTMVIAEGTYVMNWSHHTSFVNQSQGVTIIGLPTNHPPTTIISCTEEAGLSFVYSANVTILGIKFSNCTQLRNSTSYFYTKSDASVDPHFVEFYVSLYFLYCKTVTLQNITVGNTIGTSLVMYNVVDSLIESSDFSNNVFLPSINASMGGGVYIEFAFCVAYDEATGLECLLHNASNVDPNYTSGSNITILSSVFSNNTAGIDGSSNDIFILPHQQYHIAFGRGGGVSVFFKGHASNNKVTVRDCIIHNNTALWGAGFFVEFHDNVFNNDIWIDSTHITSNTGYVDSNRDEGAGGGGARVAILFLDTDDINDIDVEFTKCTFRNNVAYYGGGVSFIAAQQRTAVDYRLNSFGLYRCLFEENTARLGSAVDLSLWHSTTKDNQLSPRPIIENCRFLGNSPFRNFTLRVGFGAVYIDSLRTSFFGSVLFEGNRGTSLFVAGDDVYFADNSILMFQGNEGCNGGAISLVGSAILIIGINSHLEFIDNTAKYYGGAIYHFNSGEHDLLSSRKCFIQYRKIDVKHKDWATHFRFQNNRANGRLNAIHSSSLTPCLWDGVHGTTIVDNMDYTRIFCWNKTRWVYIDEAGTPDTQCHKYISTAPSKYSITKHYQVVPGTSSHLDIKSYDNMGNDVTEDTVLIARIEENNAGAFFGQNRSNNITYVSHKSLNIKGEPGTHANVTIETIEPIVLRTMVSVDFTSCPFGFKFHNKSSTCVCAGKFRGFLTCNTNNFTVRLSRSVWLGRVTNSSGSSVVAAYECPYTSSDIHYSVSLFDENFDYFCNHTKRTGVLCGKCRDGYGVALNCDDTMAYRCISCSDRDAHINWIYYLLANFLPITIFFATVFVFSTSVTLGSFNSFIFFAQVVTTAVKVDAEGMIPLNTVTGGIPFSAIKQLYTIPYNIWNLNFLQGLLPKFCLNTRLTALDVMSLGYLEALYTLVLLVVFLTCITFYNRGTPFFVHLFRPLHQCVARFRQCTGLHQSVTSGMAVFFIITYTKFTLISLSLLVSARFYGQDGKIKALRYYYNGEEPYPSFQYLVPAVVILCTFGIVPPLLLIYPSLLRLIEKLSCHRLRLGRLYPTAKLQAFLNEFHGCYKDGTEGGLDCRWFAGLYFILRLLLFAVYSLTTFWYQQYTVQVALFIIAAFLFAVLRPYRVDWVNNLDTTMFLVLALISSLSMYHIMLTWIDQTLVAWVFAIQYILILVPLVYCISYCCILIYKSTFAQIKAMPHRNRTSVVIQNNDDTTADNEGALADSTHVPDFLDYVQDSGRLKSRLRLSDANRWRRQLQRPQSGERDSLLTVSSSNGSGSSSEASGRQNAVRGTATSGYGATNSH